MIIEPPKTVEDFKEVEKSILEIMGNHRLNFKL